MSTTVNLYAVCTRNTYTISYTMNNGTNNSNNPTSYNVESSAITLQAPTKTLTFKGNANSTSGANAASGTVTIGSNTTKAQTFAGWTGSNGSTNQTSVTIASGSTGNKSYTAHWTAVAGTLPTVTRTGYTCGWNTSSSGTTITYSSGGSFPTSAISEGMSSTVNLYAVCTPITYTITYNRNTSSSDTTQTTDTKTYGVNYTIKNVGTGSGEINWTNSGKTFIGWTIGQSISSTGSDWYDENQSYSNNSNLTLYAQWYDVSSLENAYESFVQKGDLKKSALKTVNYRIMVDPGYETDLDMNTTCDSGYTRRIKIANFSTGSGAVRPFRINMNTTFGLRWLYTSSTSSDPYLAGSTTTSSVCSKDRPTTTSYPNDPIDTRIQRLKQLADVTIEYSEIKTKSDVKDNISLPSGTRNAEGASVSADNNYSIISHSAGFNIANASSSGTLTSRVYQYVASSTNGTSLTRIAKSYSSAAPKVKQTQYILEVRNDKKVESTFSPGAPKGLARYNALVTLNSNKSKYFPASYIKETLVKTGSESVGAWSGNSNVGKQISVSSGKLLGVSSFGVANDTNGEACSYAVINKSYVSGVNSTSGSWYTYYYAGNKNYSDTAGHATTKTYGYAYIAYISSGSLSSS